MNTDPTSTPHGISQAALLQAFDQTLEPWRFKDYCHNGLQVQGRAQVRHLVTGVTASLALIEAAAEAGADAVLVHHGLFWRGFDGRVDGWLKKRLQLLLKHDINLYAYHLPLDAHPTLGNNAQLARELGFDIGPQRCGEQDMVWQGSLPKPQTVADLGAHIGAVLGRAATVVAAHDAPIRRVAWCTGGAQGYFEAAIAAGAECYITGEISEPQAHYAREMGVGYIACGHHASERFGVRALGDWAVNRQIGALNVQHIELDNPA